MPTLTAAQTAHTNERQLREVQRRLEPVQRQEITEFVRELTMTTVESCVDTAAKPVALSLAGQQIHARPIDTRRFIRAMAPHICFN